MSAQEQDLENRWDQVVEDLGGMAALTRSAKSSGAVARWRQVRSGGELVRLVLLYALGGQGLRLTGAVARMAHAIRLSAPSLLERLRKCGPWLREMLRERLAARRGGQAAQAEAQGRVRVRLADGTGVTVRGSSGTDFRLHVGMDLQSLTIDDVELTDVSKGEKLERYTVSPGELLVADRGLAHARGIEYVHTRGGRFLLRIGWQNLPMWSESGERIDVIALLEEAGNAQPFDQDVWVELPESGERLKVRLIIGPMPPEKAAQARARIRKQAKKRGRTPDRRTLRAAGYLILLTDLDRASLPAKKALKLYRFRWQIECGFKRLKGLLGLGYVETDDIRLASTVIYGRLLAALLVEDTARLFDFFFVLTRSRLHGPHSRAHSHLRIRSDGDRADRDRSAPPSLRSLPRLPLRRPEPASARLSPQTPQPSRLCSLRSDHGSIALT